MTRDGEKENVTGIPTDLRDQLKSLQCFRKDYIQQAMEFAANDEQKAAEMLGITTEKLRLWQIRLGIGK